MITLNLVVEIELMRGGRKNSFKRSMRSLAGSKNQGNFHQESPFPTSVKKMITAMDVSLPSLPTGIYEGYRFRCAFHQ